MFFVEFYGYKGGVYMKAYAIGISSAQPSWEEVLGVSRVLRTYNIITQEEFEDFTSIKRKGEYQELVSSLY
jgi:transposase-like protein